MENTNTNFTKTLPRNKSRCKCTECVKINNTQRYSERQRREHYRTHGKATSTPESPVLVEQKVQHILPIPFELQDGNNYIYSLYKHYTQHSIEYINK
jgi:hypothetical protein